MTKNPRDYSTNVEDWWSFYGLYDELLKNGFDEKDILKIREDLTEIFVTAAFDGDWQASVDPDWPRLNDAEWLAGICYGMFFDGVHVTDAVDEFVACALEGGVESMIEAWLEGVPVEYIVGA